MRVRWARVHKGGFVCSFPPRIHPWFRGHFSPRTPASESSAASGWLAKGARGTRSVEAVGWGLVRTAVGPLLVASIILAGRRGEGALGGLPSKGTRGIRDGCTRMSSPPPKGPPPNTITPGVMVQHVDVGGEETFSP